MADKSDTAAPGGAEVNSQIADTVTKLRQMAPAEAANLAKNAEAEARALALSMALQDAVAHLRRMQVLSEAAMSLAVSKQAEGNVEAGQAIMDTANSAVDRARSMLAEAEKALA
ncbi:hypothetical protein KUV64_07290 [Mameliella alba]|uniref:hypothetical protein n=1 Tax=Mameliella TaxID=1434019 RepID=UPI0008410862|nr:MULTISPECIES: hypothetical protein [Mameliella]MBY6118927.1 hypothetical protein [Mameliella alba]MDD9733343.1 hypothetical protein [Mameliella sp. AT18]ODM48599.1 hypothetical protein A9320_02635 [Ruegeria sp. PBVC088]